MKWSGKRYKFLPLREALYNLSWNVGTILGTISRFDLENPA